MGANNLTNLKMTKHNMQLNVIYGEHTCNVLKSERTFAER